MPFSFDRAAAVSRLVAAGEKPAVAEVVATAMAQIAAAFLARPRDAPPSKGLRTFDTLGHAKHLMAAGMSREIAEAHAMVMWELLIVPLWQEQRSRQTLHA